MKVSNYMIGKIEFEKLYSISDFEKLWKIKIDGRYRKEFYSILDENFIYKKVGTGKNMKIEIFSRIIQQPKSNYTKILAELIYIVMYNHLQITLEHSYTDIDVMELEYVRVYPAKFRKMLVEMGYDIYNVPFELEHEKERFLELARDLQRRAIKYLSRNDLMQIDRYCEDMMCNDISETGQLHLYEYYMSLNKFFNTMYPSGKFRNFTAIYQMKKDEQKKFFEKLDTFFMEEFDIKYSDVVVDYHVTILDNCIDDFVARYSKDKINEMIEGLIEKSKIPIKKRLKKEDDSISMEITLEMNDVLDLFGEEYLLGA